MGDRFPITGSSRTGATIDWLRDHGQRAVVLGGPGGVAILWTPNSDPNASPRMAIVGDMLEHDPATDTVRVFMG